jgi:hypothetical protein
MAESFIGIDYSGRGTATTPTVGLQVYWATDGQTPQRVAPNSARHGRRRNWCRQELTSWLLGQIASKHRIVVGLDFSFSLPMSYFQRYGYVGRLPNWRAGFSVSCEAKAHNDLETHDPAWAWIDPAWIDPAWADSAWADPAWADSAWANSVPLDPVRFPP